MWFSVAFRTMADRRIEHPPFANLSSPRNGMISHVQVHTSVAWRVG